VLVAGAQVWRSLDQMHAQYAALIAQVDAMGEALAKAGIRRPDGELQIRNHRGES
jgi:hypothetical protein